MSAEIEGQTSFTAEQIRQYLELAETFDPDAHPNSRPLRRIKDAAQVLHLAEQLLRETVADARAIPASGKRAILENGHVQLVDQAAADKSSSRYGWDVIGAALGITKQRAHKKYSGS